MRLYLDESVPENLRFFIQGHEVRTARFMGWKGLMDGEFLPIAQHEFDAIATCDRSIPDQQNLARLNIRIIVLRGQTNGLEHLLPLLPEAMRALDEPDRGQVVHIYPP